MKRKARKKPRKRKLPRVVTHKVRNDDLRNMVREAANIGCATAIEHCQKFWHVSDAYRRYVDKNIEAAVDTIMATVRRAVREELAASGRRKR